jgi:hypothetical protein
MGVNMRKAILLQTSDEYFPRFMLMYNSVKRFQQGNDILVQYYGDKYKLPEDVIRVDYENNYKLVIINLILNRVSFILKAL